MDVKTLFSGIVAIIDDEVNKGTSSIYKIKESLIRNNISVIPFEEIPSKSIIPSLSSVSFVIIDWDFLSNIRDSITSSLENNDERISMPDELPAQDHISAIEFIKSLLSSFFVPVFLFTSLADTDSIVEELSQAGININENQARIFVKNKSAVSTENDLFSVLEEWVKNSPPAYTLKVINKLVCNAEKNLFMEMYNCSPNWVKIIWDTIKDDSIENQQEFGEFLTKNLVNRIGEYIFEEEILDKDIAGTNDADLIKIIENERFISYDDQPQQAYTGDLFKENGGKYFLNIRAQCDLSRSTNNSDENGTYNPLLFGLEGKAIRSKDIVSNDIRLTSEEQLVFENQNSFSLDKLHEICKDEKLLIDFNSNFRRYRNKVFYLNGAFVGRSDKIIICCINGEKILQFDMHLQHHNFADIKDHRIGRILPPYITQIQQKSSAYLIREGTLPTPKRVIESFPD